MFATFRNIAIITQMRNDAHTTADTLMCTSICSDFAAELMVYFKMRGLEVCSQSVGHGLTGSGLAIILYILSCFVIAMRCWLMADADASPNWDPQTTGFQIKHDIP